MLSWLQGDVDKVAAVYANALVDLAQGKNALDTVHADVDSLQVQLPHLVHALLQAFSTQFVPNFCKPLPLALG